MLSPQTTMLFDPEDVMVDPSEIEDLELLGEETVEGMPTYHLSGRARLPFSFEEPLGKATTDMDVNYWIGQADQRPVLSTAKGSIDFTGEVGATADVSMTMRIFDYDAPVEITAPEIEAATAISVPGIPTPIAIAAPLLAPLEGDTPEGHMQRGLDSLADARLGLALVHFNQALALQPASTDALLYRGAALAIDGDLEAAFADLDQAIEAAPDRADAYALRSWANLRALFRGEAEADTALNQARADSAKALELQPDLPMALSLQATADLVEAAAAFESDPEQAAPDLQAAMAELQAVLQQDAEAGAGGYVTYLPYLFQANMEDRDWLLQQVDDANAQLAEDPTHSRTHD